MPYRMMTIVTWSVVPINWKHVVRCRSAFGLDAPEGFEFQPGLGGDPLMLADDAFILLHEPDGARDGIDRGRHRLRRCRLAEADIRHGMDDGDLVGQAERVVVGAVVLQEAGLQQGDHIVVVVQARDGLDLLGVPAPEGDLRRHDGPLAPVHDADRIEVAEHRGDPVMHPVESAVGIHGRQQVPFPGRERNIQRGGQTVEQDGIVDGGGIAAAEVVLVLPGDLHGLGGAAEEFIQPLQLAGGNEGIPFEDLEDLLLRFGDIPAVLAFIAEDREGKGGNEVLLSPYGADLELKLQRFASREHEGKGDQESCDKQDPRRQGSRDLQELQNPVQAGPELSMCEIESEHRL